MESTQIQALYEPPLAVMPQLSEKPHQGFETRKTTGKTGSNSCNFTVALGLRATVVENGVRETYSARYYNPSTGRFLSRDPLDGDPTDPQSLHKYLYAGGDPVNRIDPSGRADSIETIFTITVIATPTEVALSALAGQATAAIALLQMAAGQAYLTAQYAFELIAAAGEATGISKLLVCGAVGLAVARVEAENKITDPEKTAIALLFSYTCSRLVPLPGPPPIKWF
jgi:RHS repeat-associated protein